MSRPRLAGLAAAIAAAAALTTSAFLAPAQAAPVASTAIAKATSYIEANATPSTTNAGDTIDALIGLAAGNADAATLKTYYDASITGCNALLDPVDAPGMTYANSTGAAAAKCALAAEMAGDTATAQAFLKADVYGPLNLVSNFDYAAELKNYPFGLGLEAIAFERSGLPLPTGLVAAVQAAGADPTTSLQKPFGNQLDSAGLILTAALHLPTKDTTGAQNLGSYITGLQGTSGLFPDYAPTNTTGMVAPAVGQSGIAGAASALSKAQAGMLAAQVADGGFGLCANSTSGQLCTDADTTKSDLRATNQAILALADVTLFDLSFTLPAPATTPPPTSATPTPSGTATAIQAATAADCAAQHGVWVVVADHDVATKRGCVALTGTPDAITIFKALTPAITTQTTEWGPQVCTIDGLGDCTFAQGLFWAFYVAPAQTGTSAGAWGFSQVGAGATMPAPGSAVAFDWSDGNTMPAAVAAADTPLPVPATPSETPSASPSPTQSAVPTAPVPTGSTSPAPTTSVAPTGTATQPGLANTGGDAAGLLVVGLLALGIGGRLVTRK